MRLLDGMMTRRGWWKWMGRWWALVGVLAVVTGAHSEDWGEAFDSAARLYEQGKFREAAAGYATLVTNGASTVSVWYNQGNAWYKAGEKGRAIVAYREALKLAPRDAEVASNLERVRAKVSGGGVASVGMMDRFLGRFTPNEWALAAMVGVWGWFGWMMAREVMPKFRDGTGGWSWVLAVVVAGTVVLAFLARSQAMRTTAVVIASEATVRFGPLEEAQTAFTLSDGAELVVTDRKGKWLEIRDGTGRRGWVADRHLAVIP